MFNGDLNMSTGMHWMWTDFMDEVWDFVSTQLHL